MEKIIFRSKTNNFYIIATKAIRKQAWPQDTYFKLAATMQIKLVQSVT